MFGMDTFFKKPEPLPPKAATVATKWMRFVQRSVARLSWHLWGLFLWLVQATVPGYQFVGALEASGHRDGEASLAAIGHLSKGRDLGAFQHGQHAGVYVVEEAHGTASGIRRGPHSDGHACSSLLEGPASAGEVGSIEGSMSQSTPR